MGARHTPWQQRFWRHVTRAADDECWEWTGSHNPDGYGHLRMHNRMGVPCDEDAHRLSWRLHHGAIPDGLCVLHTCDNPACVNPAHLFLGTIADNNHDMRLKGRDRHPRGEQNGRAKLTQAAVLDMRRRYAAGGISQEQLGREYGVCQSVAGRAIQGLTWKQLGASDA